MVEVSQALYLWKNAIIMKYEWIIKNVPKLCLNKHVKLSGKASVYKI